MLSESYALNLPTTYVMAALLRDSIQDIANDPQNRRESGYSSSTTPSLFHYRTVAGGYVAASILGRYVSPAAIHQLHSFRLSVRELLDLSEELFPENIARLGADFLADVQKFSANDNNWYASRNKPAPTGPSQAHPPLTIIGRSNLRSLINKYGLNGIAQTNGLSALAR